VERLNVGYLSCEEVNIGRSDQECRVYKEKCIIGKINERREKMGVKVARVKVRKARREIDRGMEKGKKEREKRNVKEGERRKDRLKE